MMLIKIHTNQTGQALPLGMGLCLILGLMSYVLFNTGQTASDKSRLVNTADSAAYSGLLWQARAMNFQAYTNRAMVANQVAMAQAVSINSWSGYIAKAGENINTALGWVPYVGAFTRVVEKIGSAIDTVLSPISKGMLSVVDAVNASLSIAQQAMYYSAFVATPDVIQSVVTSNEPTGQSFKWETAFSVINVGLNWNEWSQFTERSNGDNKVLAEQERVDIIRASLDNFSTERTWNFFGSFIPITPINWVRAEKRGTTILTEKNGKYEWFAKDALSIREKRYTWRGKKYSDIPIAGGSSVANTDNTYDSIVRNGRGPMFWEDGRGYRHKLAQTRSKYERSPRELGWHASRNMDNYGGIRAYRSLSKGMREEDAPTMQLRIQVSMDTKYVMDSHDKTTVAEGGNEFNFNANVTMPGEVMSSVSTAEMFFEKPCFDSECIIEAANGYSPYWDVRLTNTSGILRLGAHILQENVIGESDLTVKTSMGKLANYSGDLANPITDYTEQSKGVKNIISNLEIQLLSAVVGSPQYLEYEARLAAIESNVSFKLDDIASQFVEENFNKDQIIDEIAKAAGYDLEIGEFEAVRKNIENVYMELDGLRGKGFEDLKELTLEVVEDKFSVLVRDQVHELKNDLEQELTQIFEYAVDNILKGMISSFIQQKTGFTPEYSAVIQLATTQAAAGILDIAQKEIQSEGAVTDDEIKLDVTNECSMYENIRNAEAEVLQMQIRLEIINQQIADEFHIQLKIATDEAVAERVRITEDIAALEEINVYLRSPQSNMNSEDESADILFNESEIGVLNTDYLSVPNDRVEKLAWKLVGISNSATAVEFPDYNLDIRFARQSVLDTLGDISVLEVDEYGDPVSDNMMFADVGNGAASDEEQKLTEMPEDC